MTVGEIADHLGISKKKQFLQEENEWV